jgi:hypothetical protein
MTPATQAAASISVLVTDTARYLQIGPGEAVAWIDSVIRSRLAGEERGAMQPIEDVVARVRVTGGVA